MKKLFFILFLLPALSQAKLIPFNKSFPFQESSCHLNSMKASLYLRFDRKIPAEENDFSGAPLVYFKKQKTLVLEGLLPPHASEFSFVEPKESSTCEKTQAFAMNKTTIAVIYTKDNRPFHDLYQVAVIDLKSGQLLQKKELGAVADLHATSDGFYFSTLIPRSDTDTIEMTSKSGRKMTAVDKDLQALQVAKLDGAVLKFEFDPKLSYEKSDWKKFFKSEDEYLKTSGWDADKKIFKNDVVYQATYFNRTESPTSETCIAMTDKRKPKLGKSDWRCLEEQH